MTPEQFRILRARIGTELGFGNWFSPFDGSAAAYAALDPEDRIRLTNAIAAYIRANPSEFTATQSAIAANLAIADPETYGVGDALGDFVGEVGNQAADLNQTLNPFSERNRGYVLGAVALGLVLYFAGPPIIAALKKKAAK